MIPAKERMIQALSSVVQMRPIGTNLGLLNLLWAMVNGSFLQSRGAVYPALSLNGLGKGAVNRSAAALRSGAWQIAELIRDWKDYVVWEGEWKERVYEGYRVLSVDITGFWRPQLKEWKGKHYNAIAGKALPAVVLGVMATSGEVKEKRIPLLQEIVRCEPEKSEAEFRVELLKGAAERTESNNEVIVVDAGFNLSELYEAGATKFVMRGASNMTARRNQLPSVKGRGRPAVYGELVRPLPRTYKGKKIAATEPDEITTFQQDGRTITVHSWFNLVSSKSKVDPEASTFSIHVYFDPAYKNPLVLVTGLELPAPTVLAIYRDRWVVEQAPLAAKQMIGLHRQFVSTTEACFRLPELALLAGNILTHVAALSPPIPTGFWDRNPLSTPGRLRRFLGQLDFPDLADFTLEIRKKESVFDHLPKGAHSRQSHPLS